MDLCFSILFFTILKPFDNIIFSVFKKKTRMFLDDHILKEDSLKIKEEDLVYRAIDIFDNMSTNVFRRAWLNTILKESDFDCAVENIKEDDELTIAADFLEKEEEELLIQRFSELEIQGEDQEVQEVPPSQFIPKSPPKKQSKITAFFNSSL
jgi:hypothetical protein